MPMKDKKTRLPKDLFKGEASAAFTLRVSGNIDLFTEPGIVSVFADILASIVGRAGCIVPVYCFMPDHQNLIVTGKQADSDLWRALVLYKQKTGFWMSGHRAGMRWRKDFNDHVLGSHEDIITEVRSILDHPVKTGLALSWREYPFKGSIGCKLEDVLNGTI
jgi:REP element-mobilizing transposase RayT